jgi:ubiquinone/menaquinone biosynthesis C-methylase UbiE
MEMTTMTEYQRFADQERSGWSDKKIVGSYVSKFGPITDQVAQELVARISTRDKAILDLCCGQGSLTAMLVRSGANVVGVDFSQEMLDLAKEAAPGAELKRGDAGELPFDDASFDTVLCNFGMMHLPDQPRALSEIGRVLRPGGNFLMATWAVPEISPAFGTVFGAIKAHADLTNAPKQPDLFTFARADEAEKLFAAAELRITAHETVTPAWELAKPEELFDIFLTGTVGASMLIKGQKPEVVDAIGDQITMTVAEKFAAGDGYRVPVPVAVVTAASATT